MTAPVAIDVSDWPLIVVRSSTVESDQEMSAFCAEYNRLLRKKAEPFVQIADLRQVKTLSPSRRKILTDSMKDNEDFTREYCRGVALVFDSAVMRHMLTAILWLKRPPYPHRVFNSMVDAKVWGHSQLASPKLGRATEGDSLLPR